MIKKFFIFAILASLALTGYMHSVAKRDPIVRRTEISLSGWPTTETSLKLLLVSDVHVAGPDMPPERLAKIVGQMNALHPDIILFAGDFVSDKTVSTHRYSADKAIAPLGKLHARLGVLAVLGNHDHWRDKMAISNALAKNNVAVLNNEVKKIGPLVIGGVDDDFTDNSDLPKTLQEISKHKGISIILSHSPDIFPYIPNDIPLTLAGHTHCGQIMIPLFGAISTASKYGGRYGCGIIKENEKMMIVGAGLGTSILPLRLGAVPDMWLVTIGP